MIGEKISNSSFFKEGVELSCLASEFSSFLDEVYTLFVVDEGSTSFIPSKGSDYSAFTYLLKEFYFYFYLEEHSDSSVRRFFDVLFSGEVGDDK